MQTQRFLASTLVAVQLLLTSASWGNIAGYAPGSKVSDHNAIDLDQKAIENLLSGPEDYDAVKNIYQNGGSSKAYAEFSVPALTVSLSKGDAVVGATSNINGVMYSSYSIGDTSIRVAYKTSEVQATYTNCKVGALQTVPAGVTASATQPYQLLSGCYTTSESLNIQSTTSGSVIVIPSAAPTNKAGRTLQGFSTKAEGTMYTCSARPNDGCPYRDYSMYYSYYGSFDYANKFVLAAINGGPTSFGNSAGDMDFTGQPYTLRKECIKKGTAYMNAYMYAIREFEDAIDDCKAGCSNGIVGSQSGLDCNSLSTASVHAWDEGVAFYTGSREGTAYGGNSAGVLSYRLAEKRCANFKTCGAYHNATTGTSYVNTELFRQLSIGAYSILVGDCDAARPVLLKMVALMATPLIQGTLRYAYKVDKLSGVDKEKGEGAVFAAAIVPRVAFCNSGDAATIMANMKVGAPSTSFAAVKAAFENNYACMGITCAEVGGLWFSADNRYYEGAEPCVESYLQSTDAVGVAATSSDDDGVPTWAIIVIIVVGFLAVCFMVTTVVCFSRANKYKKLVATKGSESGGNPNTIGNV